MEETGDSNITSKNQEPEINPELPGTPIQSVSEEQSADLTPSEAGMESCKSMPMQEGVEMMPEMKQGDLSDVPEPIITRSVQEGSANESVKEAATYQHDPEVGAMEKAISQVHDEKTSGEKKASLDIKGVSGKTDAHIMEELEARMAAPAVKAEPQAPLSPEEETKGTGLEQSAVQTDGEIPRPLTAEKSSSAAGEPAPEIPLTIPDEQPLEKGDEKPMEKTGEVSKEEPAQQVESPAEYEAQNAARATAEAVAAVMVPQQTAATGVTAAMQGAQDVPADAPAASLQTTAKEAASMDKKAEKAKKPADKEPGTDAKTTSFGSPNEYWNALMAVISFLSMMVSYFLVGLMSSVFSLHLESISKYLKVPPLIETLRSIFVLDKLNIAIYVIIVLALFYLLHKVIKKFTTLPTFFFISFIVHFFTVFLFILVLYQYNAFFNVFGR